MKIKDAAALRENFIAKYKKKSHIDYMITGHSIKFFFNFNSNSFEQYGDLTDELNSSLIKYKLYDMCDFYMKLIAAQNSSKYNLCWIFLSFNALADYHVQRHFCT